MFAHARYAIHQSSRNKSSKLEKTKHKNEIKFEEHGKSWWHEYSCISSNKSPRSSRSYSRSNTLPYLRKPSLAEEQYESYVQATVAANSKSPVEMLETPLKTPPPPPPRRHANKITSPTSTEAAKSPLSERTASLISPVSVDGAAAADAQTLYNIRQQMAMSLKRMKDLEEQVKNIPDMESQLNQLRQEKLKLEQDLRTKEEELQKAKEVSVKSGSSSPAGSLSKHSSPPLQFTAQRISPISLESMGSRLRSNSISSEKQLRNSPPLKRDVGTMSRVYATRDVGVGSPAIPTVLQRTVGTQPNKQVDIKETLYTQLELEEHSTKLLQSHIKHQEKMLIENAKKLISVGTQMYVPKTELKENGIQTMAERKVLKYAIGIMAKPAVRENFVQCMPEMRTVGSSEHSINDVLCERCVLPKRNASCGTDAEAANVNSCISLKNLEMPARSNTFSLGDNEKIKLTRKTQGTQYTPTTVHSMASQTSLKTVHSVGVQNTAEMLNNSTQSQIDSTSAQTDTKDLIHLSTTQTNTEQYQPPKEKVVEKPILPPKPVTYSKGINTETPKTVEYGINTLPTASMCTTSSNTEAIHKRDIACGDVVKPHISIACADNYCDSCKDAIKNLAKDFSKVSAPASPLPSRAVDSKIPRPKNMPSPSMPRRQIQRQNTYTLPSPVEEKKKMSSSLQEKSLESSGEEQTFIAPESCNTTIHNKAPAANRIEHANLPSVGEKNLIAEDDLIVREEKKVTVSWSRDNSPAPLTPKSGSPLKSPESSFNEKQIQLPKNEQESLQADDSKGAKRKIPAPLLKSSQKEDLPKSPSKLASEQKPPSKALLQKLAMVEAEPREKFQPSKEMLAALKAINGSLLKKLGSKPISSVSLKPYKATITQEWFKVAGTEKSNAHEVEDYLDCIEAMSVPLLEYIVNLTDANGNTAMHYAVSHGNFDVVSILLDSKVCNVNQMNNAGYTCVMLVSLAKLKSAEHRTVVERLFQMADVNIRAKKHCQTALMLAVSHGNMDMVQMLITAGADVNIQDEDGSTALMCAAEHGRIDICKYMLTNTECNSLIEDVDGSTAFKIAWQAGHRDLGLLLYVHEQMLRSKLPNRGEAKKKYSISPRLTKPPQ